MGDRSGASNGGWRLLANCQFAAGKPDDAVATIDKAAQVLTASPVLAAMKANETLLRQAGAVSDQPLPIVLYVMNGESRLNRDIAIELFKTLAEADQSSDVERLGLPPAATSQIAPIRVSSGSAPT